MTNRRGARGAAAVEFALVAMLLLTLLFGIIEAGWALFHQGTVAGLAREGARYYALHSSDPGVAGDATEQVRDQAEEVGLVDSEHRGDVLLAFSAVDCPSASSPASDGSFVRVTVTYRHEGITGFIPGLNDIDLRGSGSMRCTG